MMIETEKVKKEIKDRMGFLNKSFNSSFADGYELALQQLLSWVNLYEDTLKEFMDKS